MAPEGKPKEKIPPKLYLPFILTLFKINGKWFSSTHVRPQKKYKNICFGWHAQKLG